MVISRSERLLRAKIANLLSVLLRVLVIFGTSSRNFLLTSFSIGHLAQKWTVSSGSVKHSGHSLFSRGILSYLRVQAYSALVPDLSLKISLDKYPSSNSV